MAIQKNRNKKSVRLSDEEKEKLATVLNGFDVKEDAAEYFNVERVTLYRISENGSGNSKNVNRIKQKLQLA